MADLDIAKLSGVVVYLAVLIGIGVVASRRVKDVRDYFAAGKQLGFWSVAFSARATGESAWLLLGLTGMGAMVGVHAFWVVIGEIVGVAGAWLLMSRRFKRLTDTYDSITIPDYLESRFRDKSHQLRLVAAGALTVFVTIYVSAQIDATGQAFNGFLGWNYYLGVFVGFGVVLAYSTSGGFLAVAWSDVFQGALMFLGLVLLPLYMLVEVDGISGLWEKLAVVDLVQADSGVRLLNWSGVEEWTIQAVFSAIALGLIGLGFLGSPQIFVRFLALKSETEISKGAKVAIIWTIMADSGAVLIGMLGRAVLITPGTDPTGSGGLGTDAEGVLPLMVEAYLHPVLVGIFIAVVLSAIMSTIDSLLVVAASAVVRDVHQQVRNPDLADDKLVPLSRLVTVILAGVALVIALAVAYFGEKKGIFWFVIFGWSGISATFCPTIILSLFWRKMTARGALWAMIVGFVSVPLFKFGAPHLPAVGDLLKTLSELPPAFAASFIAAIVVSLRDKEGQEQVADAQNDLDAAAK
jgi:sodium/proline symporter